MAIDYVIDYDCPPKQERGTEGIQERLKGRERAKTIIKLFREKGDQRPPSEMGFEFTRSTPEGQQETQLIVVQELLDKTAELKPLEHHCAGCPANRTGTPFGCMGFIQYPISSKGEVWLLDQLPSIHEPLLWLLLKQGVENFQYDGQQVLALRQESDVYFENRYAAARHLGEFTITANQTFEMMFTVGDIIPNHGAVLLLFFNAIERSELDAQEIMTLAPASTEKIAQHPFLMQGFAGDDKTILELKDFLHALYIAWTLNVKLLVDS